MLRGEVFGLIFFLMLWLLFNFIENISFCFCYKHIFRGSPETTFLCWRYSNCWLPSTVTCRKIIHVSSIHCETFNLNCGHNELYIPSWSNQLASGGKVVIVILNSVRHVGGVGSFNTSRWWSPASSIHIGCKPLPHMSTGICRFSFGLV